MADDSSQNTPYDPKDHSVAEVQAYMEEHPDQADDIKTAEANGKNRSTIVNYDVESQDPETENPDAADGADGNDPADNDDAQVVSGEVKDNKGNVQMGETVVSEEAREDARSDAEKKSADVAGGGDTKDYDPFTDPMVPSSSLAENIAAELASGEGSPTLQALHDNKVEPKDRDDKSTTA